jgi:hypothetical protein
MDWWNTACENLVIEEFAQRSMYAPLERFVLHGAHLQQQQQQGFPQEFLILFFFATAESSTIQLFYSPNVGLRARSKSLHARSRSLRPDQTVFFTGLVAKGACSTVVRLLGSRRNRRFWMPKTLEGWFRFWVGFFSFFLENWTQFWFPLF